MNSRPTTTPPPAPVASSTEEAQPVPDSSAHPDANCMKNCLRQNMARAVSAEVIETDCASSCTGETKQHLNVLGATQQPQHH